MTPHTTSSSSSREAVAFALSIGSDSSLFLQVRRPGDGDEEETAAGVPDGGTASQESEGTRDARRQWSDGGSALSGSPPEAPCRSEYRARQVARRTATST